MVKVMDLVDEAAYSCRYQLERQDRVADLGHGVLPCVVSSFLFFLSICRIMIIFFKNAQNTFIIAR